MPSFKIIGLLVLEKMLKHFTIYERGGHLGHVAWTIYINFRPLTSKAPHEVRPLLTNRFGEDLCKVWTTDGRRIMGTL